MNIAQQIESLPPYGNGTLPAGIRSRIVNNNNGLMVHVLEAGFETRGPALRAAAARLPGARLQLAQGDAAAGGAGYHVIAPDQRGYGRTTGWDGSYDADGDPFRILNMVRDATGLVYRARLPIGGRRRGT